MNTLYLYSFYNYIYICIYLLFIIPRILYKCAYVGFGVCSYA